MVKGLLISWGYKKVMQSKKKRDEGQGTRKKKDCMTPSTTRPARPRHDFLFPLPRNGPYRIPGGKIADDGDGNNGDQHIGGFNHNRIGVDNERS